jgi:hypothetical protein
MILIFFNADEDEDCDVGSELKRCRNGLFCDPSTRKCNMPGVKNKCLIDYHNRRLVKLYEMAFYVKAKYKEKMVYFPVPYASDIELPTCEPKTGKYELKQCRRSK